jgi:SAM-dependent methyltransferase
MMKRLLGALGSAKYAMKNWVLERTKGRETQFHFDLDVIEPIVRTAYYNSKPFGFTTRCMITERVVEYPLTFQALPFHPTAILDIGSGNSPLPYHLACLGHTVHVVDILPYPLQHPNIFRLRCDAMRLPYHDDAFEYVTAISSLEHFGLGGYGDPVQADAVFKARDEIRRVMKDGAKLIVSLPVGKENDPNESKKINYIVFTSQLLSRFTQGFDVLLLRFFQHVNHNWIPCTDLEAFGTDSLSQGVASVAFLTLAKQAQ